MRIAGYPATEIAAHSAPTWETLADGGCGEATWEFALSMTSQHQALRPGTLVEILCGPLPVYSGLMMDVDRTTWQCTAYGLSANSKNYLALDNTESSTRDLYAAISRAIAVGWKVANVIPISGVVSGEATGNPISVGQLLDDAAVQNGQRWGVDHKRRLFIRSDPTQATWLASPGSAALGSSDEGRAGKLYGRYLDSGTDLYATASAGTGVELAVDLADRGAMTNAQAVEILNGMLTREHRGPAWTHGVTLSREQLQTIGGTPAFLASVRGGQMVRSLGMSNAAQPLALDMVIGKTRYTAGEDVIYVEPVNTAPRNLTDVIAAA